MTFNLKQIHVTQYVIVSIVLAILVFVFHESTLDHLLISPFYSKIPPHWPWRNSFVTEKIIHKGGVKFIILFTVSLLGICFLNGKIKKNKLNQFFICFSILASALSIEVIYLLKKINPIQCPWNLDFFSGNDRFVSLYQFFDTNLSFPKCFPAGHSSAAYAWISFYFASQLITGKKNYKWLLPGLILGFVYGFDQQIRGAHFFSHDIATLFLCWIISGGMAIMAKIICDWYMIKKELKNGPRL